MKLEATTVLGNLVVENEAVIKIYVTYLRLAKLYHRFFVCPSVLFLTDYVEVNNFVRPRDDSGSNTMLQREFSDD